MENNENAMNEILKAIEVAARLKDVREMAEKMLARELTDMENLSRTDNLSHKVESAKNASKLYSLINVLNTFNYEYTLNRLNGDIEDHLDCIMRLIK